jgi:tRNA G18 (ribose-2'-O)-methylase SpoU
MIRIHHLSSLAHPELHPYLTLRRPLDHLRQRIVVAEGEKVVRRLLESDLHVRSLLLTPEWLEPLEPSLQERSHATIDVFLAERSLLQRIVGFRFHQGVMALGEVPPEPTIALLPSPHLIVALDGLHHAENVGVIARNAAALGADALIAGQTAASPYLRRAVRNSMGAVFRLPIFHPPSLLLLLSQLAGRYNTRLVAADLRGATTPEHLRPDGNLCVIFGNEQNGVSAQLLARSSLRVRIPMEEGTDSLNVGSASAIILHAIRQNRIRGPS